MVKVLFDHNMPPIIPRALDILVRPDGHEAWALRDRFPTTVADIDYFSELSREGNWVVISKDLRRAGFTPPHAGHSAG
jgi:hypothetical protein